MAGPKKVSGVIEIFFILFGVAILVVQVYMFVKKSSKFKLKICAFHIMPLLP